ncbi:MAG TPA: YggS family pyridoxal phosphate-dependent enzyme [Burkholderiales bacterium]|nr:YggS family pyridoxal phosphate-dependent enzyme [Burkholderiales bacterium]
MATIADNLQAVKSRIRRAAEAAGRDPESVRLLAVSKTHAAPLVAQAAAAGQRAFGENYVQEAVEKMAQLPDGLEWHLIGPLQSNKTRLAAERFDWVHTVASEKIARRLSEQRQELSDAGRPPLNVLIQVNASGEETKSGVAPAAVAALASAIAAFPGIRLRGLMAIPEPGASRERFHEVKSLYDALKGECAFDTLSMGMSDDMELAIAEGSTMVRIGTAIFGLRTRHESQTV